MDTRDTPTTETAQRERHRDLLDVVQTQLASESGGGAAEMAEAACLSRYHFQRVFRTAVGETPGGVRRRVLLERAAHTLRTTTSEPVTTVALEAGYRSHEGFCRAFRRAYGMSPSEYRRAARRIRALPGTSGVHFDPRSRHALRVDLPGGRRNMDLTERLFHSDYTAKRQMLECARLLTDRQLDVPLTYRVSLVPWDTPPRTLRESLSGFTRDGWIEVMYDRVGWQPVDTRYQEIEGDTPDAMMERFESRHRNYMAFVDWVCDGDRWDQEWVDDTCDQPETFAIGRVIEETLTRGFVRRILIQRHLEEMGFTFWEQPEAADVK